MDLSTIKKNIENGLIRSTAEFQRDIMLMFQNAVMYNSSDHDVYHMAVEMQRDVLEQIQVFWRSLNVLARIKWKYLKGGIHIEKGCYVFYHQGQRNRAFLFWGWMGSWGLGRIQWCSVIFSAQCSGTMQGRESNLSLLHTMNVLYPIDLSLWSRSLFRTDLLFFYMFIWELWNNILPFVGQIISISWNFLNKNFFK